MIVEVTQQDIDCGVRMNSSGCPIASACRRAGLAAVAVMTATVLASSEDGSRMAWALPYDAKCFVQAFDLGQPVKPLSVDLGEAVRVWGGPDCTTGAAYGGDADLIHKLATGKGPLA